MKLRAKKVLPYIAVAALVVFVVAGVVYAVTASRANRPLSETKKPYEVADACQILTKAIAADIWGSGANQKQTKPTLTSMGNATDCTYTKKDLKMSLSILTPRNAGEQKTIISNFTSLKSIDGQPVSNLGSQAFWSHTYGQLNIIASNRWFVVEYGPANNPSSRTQAQALQVAKAIQARL
jgi:hypothetical protein